MLKRVNTHLIVFKTQLFPIPSQSLKRYLMKFGLQDSIVCMENGTDYLLFVYCGAIAVIFL